MCKSNLRGKFIELWRPVAFRSLVVFFLWSCRNVLSMEANFVNTGICHQLRCNVGHVFFLTLHFYIALSCEETLQNRALYNRFKYSNIQARPTQSQTCH